MLHAIFVHQKRPTCKQSFLTLSHGEPLNSTEEIVAIVPERKTENGYVKDMVLCVFMALSEYLSSGAHAKICEQREDV
uniref:Uncharacterized protein n=1 Tax=Steinernema glaseri TaxID=37863 RepID=A0A1I7ZQB7_9BILA